MTYDARERAGYTGEPVECFLFSMGTTEFRYTSADEVVTLWPGDPGYTPVPLVRSAFDWDAEDRSGTMEVTLPGDDAVSSMFVAYVPPEPVALTVYRTHRDDGSVIVAWTGRVASARFENGRCALTCQPVRSLLRRRIPRVVYQGPCNWALYSPQCGVDKMLFRDAAVITAINGDEIQAPAFGAHGNGWFNNGWVELGNGDRRFIVKQVGDTVTLLAPFTTLVVGDLVHAFAGCKRTEADCSTKFSNLARHLGFPRVPSRNPYTAGIV